MPTTIPIAGAGEFTLTETRENIYASLGSLRVKSIPDYAFEVFGSAEISGEGFDPSFESFEVKGIVAIPVVSAMDAGELPDSLSYGSLDEGLIVDDPALGSEEITGELEKPAFGLLSVGAPGGFTGTTEYGSLGSLLASTDRKNPALAAADIAGQKASPASLGLSVRTDRNTPAYASFEAAEFGRSKPALSSLETAQFIDDEALAAAEIQDGDSVEFIIDIQDEILASGHGDC